MDYKIQIDIFEGPMDLLVHLVKKNDLDIYNIPIAFITKQYLEYIKILQMLNIDFAGDFLLMASTLSHIKSKMLLPYYNTDDDDDPRLDIVRPLLEYIEIKSAAEKLMDRDILGDSVFKRGKQNFTFDEGRDETKVGLFELVDAFNQMMENCYDDHTVDDSVEEFSIQDMISEIVYIFSDKRSVVLTELFIADDPYRKKVVIFLAVLEMTKREFLEISQLPSGTIRLFYKGPSKGVVESTFEDREFAVK